LIDILFRNTWAWWAAGIGIGLSAVALAFVLGRRLGVSAAYTEACAFVADKKPMGWKFWFAVGIPLGALLATVKGWSWTLLFGRMDALTCGNSFLKILLLFLGGILIGFGTRWAGGCTSGHTLMGIGLKSKMSILATVVFLAAAALMAKLIVRGM